MADVFLSYARADRARAEEVVAELRSQGLTVWYDTEIPAGERFEEVILAELDAAKFVIVLWSEESVKSRWVRREAERGDDHGKLVPVSIDGANPPWRFQDLHTRDVSAWPKGTGDTEFSRLLADLGVDVGQAEAPATLLTEESEDGKVRWVLRNVIGFVLALTGLFIGAAVIMDLVDVAGIGGGAGEQTGTVIAARTEMLDAIHEGALEYLEDLENADIRGSQSAATDLLGYISELDAFGRTSKDEMAVAAASELSDWVQAVQKDFAGSQQRSSGGGGGGGPVVVVKSSESNRLALELIITRYKS